MTLLVNLSGCASEKEQITKKQQKADGVGCSGVEGFTGKQQVQLDWHRNTPNSLEAAAVFPGNTDAARDDDVARRGREHTSSFTLSVT